MQSFLTWSYLKVIGSNYSRNLSHCKFYCRFQLYCIIAIIISLWLHTSPSKNRLERNMQILQVFFLQDLQDLASLALKMKLFLQDMKNLARKICKIIFLQDSCKIFISCNKSFIFSAKLARYVQDLVQDLTSFTRKILARFA